MKLCIYHGGCTDGVAAAWAIWRTDPTFVFYPGVYQQEPPWELIRKATQVLLVDFSYKLAVIKKIIGQCKGRVTILDHHKTAQHDLGPALEAGLVYGRFDMEKCGAMLAWEWSYGMTSKPKLLYEIDKQDRWLNNRDPQLIMALRSYPHKPSDNTHEAWIQLMKKWDWLMSNTGLESLRNDGRAIYRYYRQRIDETKGHERWITLGGRLIPVLNAPFFMASDVAGELAEEHDGIGAVWWMNKDSGVTFSLRSRGDFDVSKLACWYGGGGHKNAAGFRLSPQEASHLLFEN